MIVINTRLPKVCFAKPGDVIQLPLPDTGEAAGPLYLVCTIPESTAAALRFKAASVRGKQSKGLYAEERPFWVVNLETGEGGSLPHLSSRCRIVRDATVTFTELE